MNSEEKITWKVCKNCNLLQHLSHLRCLSCKHDKFKDIDASGECRLVTFTILNAPPAEFIDKKSYAIGVVEFENGVKSLGQITTRDKLYIGMKLKPIFTEICKNLDSKEVFGFSFKPI
jgi:uncharacterized OB-fold protein